jgi:energy-converting hydrogenase Eha subunit A
LLFALAALVLAALVLAALVLAALVLADPWVQQVRPARTSEQWSCLMCAGDVPSSATAGAAYFAHVLCARSLLRVHVAADRPHRRDRATHGFNAA